MEENQNTNNRSGQKSSNLWLGLIFIFGGAVVLLNQTNILPFELNWWALFILLPAGGILTNAYTRFQSSDNALTMEVMIQALIGLFMVGLSFSMLVGVFWKLNWSLLWPLILILIGLGMIFGRPKKE